MFMRKIIITTSAARLAAVFLTLCIVAYIVFIVAHRSIEPESDSFYYRAYFDTFTWLGGVGRFEPGFGLFTRVVSDLGAAVEHYFGLICATIIASYFWWVRQLVGRDGSGPATYLALTIFFLCSSWFVVAVANGVRQGMSLPFVYLSLEAFARRRWGVGAAYFLVSVSFHTASLLLAPFLLLVLVAWKRLVAITTVVALAYPTGVNEALVRFVSRLLGLDVYNSIRSYGLDSGAWVGFQADLYLYSLFWLYLLAGSQRFLKSGYWAAHELCVKLYAVLLLPYLIFGFGGYSNRYAVIAWFALPGIWTLLLQGARFSVRTKLTFMLCMLCFGLVYFSYRLG